jgi:YbbR domain-containing protein
MGRITRFILQNWPWKLLSLSAAALLWMAVASEPEMSTYIRVPVVYKDAPENLEISSTIENSVRVQVSGVSSHLREASLNPPPVVLDLSSVRAPGVRTFDIDASDVRLRGVEFLSSAPAQLHFTFENRLERSVPVQVQWSGTLPQGKRMEAAHADPAQMMIVGPASHVQAVRSVSTDPIDLGLLHDGEVVTTTPFVDETQVRFQKFQIVHVQVVIKD